MKVNHYIVIFLFIILIGIHAFLVLKLLPIINNINIITSNIIDDYEEFYTKIDNTIDDIFNITQRTNTILGDINVIVDNTFTSLNKLNQVINNLNKTINNLKFL